MLYRALGIAPLLALSIARGALAAPSDPGHVYVSDDVTGAVYGYALSPSDGTPYGHAVFSVGGFKSPRGLAVDAAGHLYVTDDGARTLTVLAPPATTPIYTLAFRAVKPSTVAVDANGFVYVGVHRCCELGETVQAVLEYRPTASGALKLYAKSGFSTGLVTGLSWRRGDDALFETFGGESGYFFLFGSLRGSYGEQFCGAESPAGIATGPSGSVFVADAAANILYAYPRPVTVGCGPDYRIAAYNVALDFVRAGSVAAGHGDIYVTTRGAQPGVVTFSARAHGFVYAYLFWDYPSLKAPSGIALGP
jgi:sugar lactone lactonase YvrE